jgi:hypothetical protein
MHRFSSTAAGELLSSQLEDACRAPNVGRTDLGLEDLFDGSSVGGIMLLLLAALIFTGHCQNSI